MYDKKDIIIIDARDFRDFNEEEGGRWITFCILHGNFIQHETRTLARDWKDAPSEWCDGCYEEQEKTKEHLTNLRSEVREYDFYCPACSKKDTRIGLYQPENIRCKVCDNLLVAI